MVIIPRWAAWVAWAAWAKICSPEKFSPFRYRASLLRPSEADMRNVDLTLSTSPPPKPPATNFVDAIIEHFRQTHTIPTAQILEQQRPPVPTPQDPPVLPPKDIY